MIKETKLSNDQNTCYIELSVHLGSVNVMVSDDSYDCCKFFSFAIDIEPYFTLENSQLKTVSVKIQNIFDENDSDLDDHEGTQFRTSWYKVSDNSMQATSGIFSSEINGVIKECIINKDLCFNLKLPIWASNMVKQLCNTYNQTDLEDFLLTVLQLRITIWGASSTIIESAEIFEIGEVVIKISENHLVSKNSFYFIHKVPDHDALVIKEYKRKGEQYTVGILKCFFNSRPVITRSNNRNLKVICENSTLPHDVLSESPDLNQKLKFKENIHDQSHDFVLLQWEYLDDNNQVRGPYNSIVMMSWIIKGYFSESCRLRLFEIGQGHSKGSKIPRKFKEFQSLRHCFNIIKSDVSRMFRYSSNHGLSKYLFDKVLTDEKICLNGTEINDKLASQELNTKSNPTFHESKRIEIENAVNMLKEQFSHIEKEFKSKFKRKIQGVRVENSFNSETVDKNKDEFIEFAAKNVFRQKNNIIFKKWGVEYGPNLVLEACAIRIQTAYRNYIRKKYTTNDANFKLQLKS